MHTPIKVEMGLFGGGRRLVEGRKGNGVTMNTVHGMPTSTDVLIRPIVLYSENLQAST